MVATRSSLQTLFSDILDQAAWSDQDAFALLARLAYVVVFTSWTSAGSAGRRGRFAVALDDLYDAAPFSGYAPILWSCH